MELIKKAARVLIFAIHKGGVGKTNSAKNIAAALALQKKKVLLIDFDPQANATIGLLKNRIPLDETIYNLLIDSTLNWKNFIKVYKNGNIKFDILPGGNNLAIAELELAAKSGREFIFRNRILSKIQEEGDYDFILVDCPPSLGLLVINVLCSSNDNEIIICARPDEDSQEAITFLFLSINSLKEDLNVMPKSFRILITQLLIKETSHRQNLNMIEKEFPDELFQTQIRKDANLEKARNIKSDIFNYAPKTRAASEYMKVANEIIGDHND